MKSADGDLFEIDVPFFSNEIMFIASESKHTPHGLINSAGAFTTIMASKPGFNGLTPQEWTTSMFSIQGL